VDSCETSVRGQIAVNQDPDGPKGWQKVIDVSMQFRQTAREICREKFRSERRSQRHLQRDARALPVRSGRRLGAMRDR
jgi:hypothetical protein